MTMKNELNKLSWKSRIMLLIIISLLIIANLALLQKLDEHAELGTRFTFQDWVMLYNICQTKEWVDLKKIVETYWNKQTDFKNFILLEYESNR